MDRKDILKSMIQNMIKGQDAEASADFHRYSKGLMHAQYAAQTGKKDEGSPTPPSADLNAE